MRPSDEEILEALAAGFDAGLAPAEVLAVIARAGPASARTARRLTEALRTGTLGAALAQTQKLASAQQALIVHGEETGRLSAALRWLAGVRHERRERWRAIRGAVIVPLLLAVLTYLLEFLPAAVMGGGAGALPVRELVRGVLVVLGAWLVLSQALARTKLSAHLRAFVRRVPLVSSLVRMDEEAHLAGVIAVFVNAGELGQAPRAARLVAASSHATALERASADPHGVLSGFSESFSLALAMGLRAGELPSRMSAFHRAGVTAVTRKLVVLARIAAYAVVIAVSIPAAQKMMAASMPGLDGALQNLPQLQELEKELDNAGH